MNREIEKAVTRQVGDSHPKNPDLVWTEYKPGKFDWRGKKKSDGDGDSSNDDLSSDQKLQAFLQKTNDKSLKQFAMKPGNQPKLRQAAYDELVKRGVDVSDIDMNNGKLGKMKQAFKQPSNNFKFKDGGSDDTIDYDYSQIPDVHQASEKTWKNAIDIFEGQNIDYFDPTLISKVFGGLKTKAQRIEFDKFVSDVKRNDPYYLSPDEEIFDLNRSYLQALTTSAPLLIASGGAGVGKSYNFKLVAEICDLKQFDPNEDSSEDQDYDWVEAPNPKSEKQFFELLKQHNGKTLVFDDADGMYSDKDTIDLLKKATNPSGRRIVGRGNESIEFTGQIISITNKSAADLTKNEDMKAIFSRADKKDIYFTKEEQLYFIESRLHDMNFDALDRLPNQADDIAEREEVFKILKDNIDLIDPMKFNSRSLKDAITAKRKAELSQEKVKQKGVLAQRAFGTGSDWKKNLLRELTKGGEDEIGVQTEMTFEKALEIFNL